MEKQTGYENKSHKVLVDTLRIKVVRYQLPIAVIYL